MFYSSHLESSKTFEQFANWQSQGQIICTLFYLALKMCFECVNMGEARTPGFSHSLAFPFSKTVTLVIYVPLEAHKFAISDLDY